jgi:hypothetical protein
VCAAYAGAGSTAATAAATAATPTAAAMKAATTATTAAATSATPTAATSATPTAAAGQSELLVERRLPGVFLVKDVERRQANVGEFLLAKKKFITL